jgi:hypothetical protein
MLVLRLFDSYPQTKLFFGLWAAAALFDNAINDDFDTLFDRYPVLVRIQSSLFFTCCKVSGHNLQNTAQVVGGATQRSAAHRHSRNWYVWV